MFDFVRLHGPMNVNAITDIIFWPPIFIHLTPKNSDYGLGSKFLPMVEFDLPPRRRKRSTFGNGKASEPNRAVFKEPIWLHVDFWTSSEYLNLKISDRNLKKSLNSNL